MAIPYNDEGIPTIPDIDTSSPDEVLRALKAWVERRQGDVGDGFDRAVTLRDLIESNVISDINAYSILHNGTLASVPEFITDPSIPPTPSHLRVAGAVENIITTWLFPRTYTRLSHFELWRGVEDNIAEAVLHAQPHAMIYTDFVGPNAVYYYWVRAVSDSGMSAFSRLEGVKGSTAMDVGGALDSLVGTITEDHLHITLGTRIGLIDGPETTPGTVNARVKNERDARTAATQAIAQDVTSLSTNVGLLAADLVSESVARSNAEGALAQDIITAQARANDAVVAVQQESIARATADGELFAQYTVKLDVNGYVSGYGLASTSPAQGGGTSVWEARADRFAIASPTGPGVSPVIPFIVQTTPSIENGVEVPVGVYMESAMIRNGTITNVKIGDAAIDTAKVSELSADKITFGEMSGERIAANTLDANRITAQSFTSRVASITNAYIDAANIVDLAVTTAKIANSAITAAKIVDLAVVSAKIGNGAITTAKIGDLQVDTIKLAGNSVSTTNYITGLGTVFVPVVAGDVVVVTACGQQGYSVMLSDVLEFVRCSFSILVDTGVYFDTYHYHSAKMRALFVDSADSGSTLKFHTVGTQTNAPSAMITIYRR